MIKKKKRQFLCSLPSADGSLEGKLIKALSDIATPNFSNTGSLKETPGYGATMDDDDSDDDDDEVDAGSDRDGKYNILDAVDVPSVVYFYYVLHET